MYDTEHYLSVACQCSYRVFFYTPVRHGVPVLDTVLFCMTEVCLLVEIF